MEGNIITAAFAEGETKCVANGLWQWDFGQILHITGLDLPRAVELHMYQKQLACTRIGQTEDGVTSVALPDTMLQVNMPITIYLYLHTEETDGETEYKISLPIAGRPKPIDYDITDPEVSEAYQALVDALAILDSDIQIVEGYFEGASEAASNAANSATEAESYAVGGTGTREGEDTDNAKYYAECAEHSYEHGGYASFDIDLSTGDLYVTVTEALKDEVSFEINTATGDLEVIVA